MRLEQLREKLEQKLSRMKPTEQKFIIAARQDGIYWRGESFEQFHQIYSETCKMRDMGLHEYRMQAIANLRKLIATMT